MKILQITPYYHPEVGGIESFTASLFASLHARGHEIKVIASHSGRPLPDETDLDGILIHRVHWISALTNRDPAGILRAKKAAARVKQEFSADVIHLHLGCPMAALYLMTADAAPAPLVVTVHDLLPGGQDSIPIRSVLESARRSLAVSQVRLEECRQLAPRAASRMQLIYNSLPWQAVDETVSLSPAPLLLMAGRQVAKKGFDVALESFSQVLERFPSARLVLVGDGPLHAQLAQKIQQMHLESAVELTGRLPDAALARLYRQVWVTLVPSLHSESFGLVALEAMQAGCPVIASRTGGLGEVVLDEETGLLFPVGDVQALTGAVLRMLENPLWARELGQAGKKRAQALFDWETCVDSYEAAFQEAVSK